MIALLYALMHWLSSTAEPFGERLLFGAVIGAVIVGLQIVYYSAGWQSFMGLRQGDDAEREPREEHPEGPER